jgi:hypothetical protein
MTTNVRSVTRPRRAKRHPRLSDEHARLISRLIDDWTSDAPITWSDVVTLASSHLHVKWSRQTLEKRTNIKDAYLRKFAQRDGKSAKGARPKNSDIEDLEKSVLNLKAENEKLRETLLEYDRRLVRYMSNAIAHGLNEEQMEAPVRPVIDPLPMLSRRRKQKR